MTDRADAMTRAEMEAADAAAPTSALLDERTFHALYARTAAPLRAYIARAMATTAHADDILQETFLRLLRTPLATRDLDELRAYAFRVAGNLMTDHWRARRHESDEPAPDHGRTGPDLGLRVDVRRLFARLTPRDRQLMWLAHVEQASHQEIAQSLGLKAGSIRVLLSRARGRLASLLRANGREEER